MTGPRGDIDIGIRGPGGGPAQARYVEPAYRMERLSTDLCNA
jgi:hypothetical protein